MDTVLSGRSSTVTIGAEQPFCVIGERINPTGRKVFSEELRGGNLDTVVVDAKAQVEAGADMLDVNAGIPLVDESELLAKMLKLVQDTVDVADLHRLLGDRGARGRARGLRGQAAGELGDRRGRAARGDPAAGGPPRGGGDRPGQRRDRHPRDPAAAARHRPQDRERRRRPRHPARGRGDRPAGDDRGRGHRGGHHHPRRDPADPRRAGREHVPGRLQRVLRPARPPRAERRLPADGDGRRPDQRDHEHRAGVRGERARGRPAAGPRPLGRAAGSPPIARARRRWPRAS